MQLLIYTSKLRIEQQSNVFSSFLATTEKIQKENGFTGVLLYTGDIVLEILEGETKKLTAFYESLSEDERFYDIEKLNTTEIAYSLFSDWSHEALFTDKELSQKDIRELHIAYMENFDYDHMIFSEVLKIVANVLLE